MSKNDYNQNQNQENKAKNTSENTQKNQGKNSSKESGTNCKESNSIFLPGKGELIAGSAAQHIPSRETS